MMDTEVIDGGMVYTPYFAIHIPWKPMRNRAPRLSKEETMNEE
jgi:hypothetical protein